MQKEKHQISTSAQKENQLQLGFEHTGPTWGGLVTTTVGRREQACGVGVRQPGDVPLSQAGQWRPHSLQRWRLPCPLRWSPHPRLRSGHSEKQRAWQSRICHFFKGYSIIACSLSCVSVGPPGELWALQGESALHVCAHSSRCGCISLTSHAKQIVWKVYFLRN